MDIEELLRKVLEENHRLKERITELEGPKGAAETLRPGAGKGGSTDITKMVRLLEQKDKRLESYAEELEEKKEQLEKSVVELKKKNEDLQTMIGSLRLVQEIFENDLTPTLGLNKEGKVVLFNRAAEALFGANIMRAVGRPVAELCAEVAEGVEAALRDGLAIDRELQVAGPARKVHILPLGPAGHRRGVVVRFLTGALPDSGGPPRRNP